ncbi:MAG TPA: CdaR family protein [Candidatus Limnocylindrales bacterium]|jgi:YbbR domain-containing protein
MTMPRALRRTVGFVTHNWPLKLAAIGLATFLYAGLVASQDASTVQGPITVTDQNRPPGTIITNQLKDVDSIRYLAPAGSQRPRASDFRATIDLTNVKPDGQPVNVPVRVTALDPDITIMGVTPRTIQVVLESSAEKQVPVRVERGPAPDRIDVGETTYTPEVVTVRGPASAVASVVAAEVVVALDPQGFDVDREIEARPVDANGDPVTGIDVEPATVHVQIPLFTNKESRTLAVSPVVAGAPAPGFRIANVTVTPLTVTVEGDAEQLAALVSIDTAPVSVAGATASIRQTVALAPPNGIASTGAGTVTVSVAVEPVTETRTLGAGLRLDGQDPTLTYTLSVDKVLLTLFGSTADLDRLGAGPLEVGLNVAGLGTGDHEVTVVPVIPSGVEVVTISPRTVSVTIAKPAAASPASATATPDATATPAGSAAPSGGAASPSP